MSRFVSAGSGDGQPATEQDEAWSKAQQQIEATKQQKAIASQQGGGTSLFETLQANKAAKQEAFEEATRLRNQFRSLDEDEVDFLESVSSASRTKEAEMKRETLEQLEAFRKQQEEAENAAQQDEGLEAPEATESWSVGSRKRKKGREKEGLGGLKVRRVSTAGKDTVATKASPAVSPSGEKEGSEPAKAPETSAIEAEAGNERVAVREPISATTAPRALPALGLGAYFSDEDS